MTLFRPGNIDVDEQSTSGDARHPNSPPSWPSETQWKQRMDHWLPLIATQSRVAQLVLSEIEQPPRTGSRPAVYLNRSSQSGEAFTDGPIPPGTPTNPTATEAIFVTYSPPDSYGAPVSTDPMRYPAPVLLHEFVHVLMAINGLNGPFSWSAAAYPTRGEFWATTLQNMMLSELGAVLSDGYNADDPTIGSVALQPASPGPVGLRADRSRSSTDLARFVRSYHAPLVVVQSQLPNFASRLAALDIPFNPFRELRRQQSLPAGGGGHGTLGGARPPGPTGRD